MVMLILGIVSKLMMFAGLAGFIYGLFKSDELVKGVALAAIAGGIVIWVITSAALIPFSLVAIVLLAAGLVFTLRKSHKKLVAIVGKD